TRWRAIPMMARLDGDIKCAAGSLEAGQFERLGLRMKPAVAGGDGAGDQDLMARVDNQRRGGGRITRGAERGGGVARRGVEPAQVVSIGLAQSSSRRVPCPSASSARKLRKSSAAEKFL